MRHEATNHVKVEDWGISRLALEYMLDRKDGYQTVAWGALLGSGTSPISRGVANDSANVPGRKDHGSEAIRPLSTKNYLLNCRQKKHGVVWRNT
jgi:hypothetical protein